MVNVNKFTSQLLVFLGRFVRIGTKPRIDVYREVQERRVG